MRPIYAIVVLSAAIIIATARRAEAQPHDPGPVGHIDPWHAQADSQVRDQQAVARRMRITRVVGASLFAVHYGASFITALLVPSHDKDDEYESAARLLMVPVVGPFIAAPQLGVYPIGFGIAQGAGVITYALGWLLDDSSDGDRPEGRPAVTIAPLVGSEGASLKAELRF